MFCDSPFVNTVVLRKLAITVFVGFGTLICLNVYSLCANSVYSNISSLHIKIATFVYTFTNQRLIKHQVIWTNTDLHASFMLLSIRQWTS